MQVLLSSIGTRGDVQPIVALGVELQALGHRARMCVPPNFKEWVESYGLECVPIGPDLKKMTGGTVTGKPVLPSKEQLQQMADQMVRGQFQVLAEAARDCDLILAATALQIATRSIAEAQSIRYVFVVYCPAALPSSKYPPTKMGGHHSFSLSEAENGQFWKENEADFDKFGAVLNEERAKLGLKPVTNVRRHMFTDRPWLAADPALAPAFPLTGMEVVQTGAWMLSEGTALPASYLPGVWQHARLRPDCSSADRSRPPPGVACDPLAGLGRSHARGCEGRLPLNRRRGARKAVPTRGCNCASRRGRNHTRRGTGGHTPGHHPAQLRSVLLGAPNTRAKHGCIQSPAG